MGRRHLARELALKVLFELETDGGDAERSLQYHVAESRADAEVAEFARTLIQGVRDHQTEIDAHLAEASSNWGLDQMAKVERTLLRIASFEIRYLPSVRRARAADPKPVLSRSAHRLGDRPDVQGDHRFRHPSPAQRAAAGDGGWDAQLAQRARRRADHDHWPPGGRAVGALRDGAD